MSRSSGAGSPIFFRCTRCKKYSTRTSAKRGMNYEATGNVRPAPTRKHHARGIRSANHSYEYRCLDCGHVGWSTHNDVERAHKRRLASSPQMRGSK